MANGKKSRSRRGWLIYPRFQLTLVAMNTGVLLAVFAVLSIQLNRAFGQLRQSGIDLNLGESHPYFKFLTLQAQTVVTYLGWGFVLATVISSLGILMISHRLAGPIVRLNGYLKRISDEGPRAVTPLKFRKGDFFSELAGSVNQAFSRVLQEIARK